MTDKKIIGLWGFVFAIIAILLLFYFKSVGSSKISIAEHGIYDLTSKDFEPNSVLKLHGEVEFYYDTLLTPDDFHHLPNPIRSGFIEMPNKWNDFKHNSETIGGHGKCTYRFIINVPNNDWYGLKIKEFKSAYSIWINAKHYGGAGIVAPCKEEMKPSRLRKEYYFQAEEGQIEVIIQVSNFHHYKGGATDTIIFGLSNNLIAYKNLQIGIETFVFGILFILFIYHLALYAYRKKDKSILYFSLLCLAMFLRLGYVSEKILLDIAPFIPWGIAVRIEYISFYSIAALTVLFAQKFFPDEIGPRLVKIISYLSLAFIATVLFTTPTIFSFTPKLYSYTVGSAAAYLLTMVIVALFRRREYSTSIFLGYFIFFLFSVNDLLYYNNTIDTTTLMPIGLLVLTFSQAYVLAKKMSVAHSKIELLSNELSTHAIKLETIVKERTADVLQQKEKIENQKNELFETAEELKTSNEKLISLANYKKDMTSMMIHDLKNPLSNIIGFTSLPNELEKYKDVIRTSGWEMQNLIQNILDVEKYDSVKMEINSSKTKLNEIVNLAYETTCYMILENQIRYINSIPEDQFVTIDKELIIRVFSNLLSNASKYADKNGVIELNSKIITQNGKKLCQVNIYNSGEPIPLEKLDSVFQKYVQLENADDRIKYSTGIGLTFCRMAIEAHGGKIGAIPGEEKGVNFWFTLPV